MTGKISHKSIIFDYPPWLIQESYYTTLQPALLYIISQVLKVPKVEMTYFMLSQQFRREILLIFTGLVHVSVLRYSMTNTVYARQHYNLFDY